MTTAFSSPISHVAPQAAGLDGERRTRNDGTNKDMTAEERRRIHQSKLAQQVCVDMPPF